MKANSVLARKVVEEETELIKRCKDLEYRVFLDEDYIKPNEEEELLDYKEYPNYYFIAAFADDKLVGCWRNIYEPDKKRMDEGVFPTIDSGLVISRGFDVEGYNEHAQKTRKDDKLLIYEDQYEKMMKLDPRKTVDMCSAAILKEHRTGDVSKALFSKVLTSALEMPPIRHGLGVPDTRWYEKIVERGYPLEPLGPSTFYWGSESTPIYVDFFAVPKGIQKLAIPIYRTKGYFTKAFGIFK
ncbi:MAG: hypothetical protein ACOCQ4_01535 [bacterium]